jgi:hypothetical protein
MAESLAVYACVPMTSHVHLPMTPETDTGISSLPDEGPGPTPRPVRQSHLPAHRHIIRRPFPPSPPSAIRTNNANRPTASCLPTV